MKKIFLFLGALVAAVASYALYANAGDGTFETVEIDLRTQLLEESEQVQWQAVGPMGVKMIDGVATRVAADAADANAVISGKYHGTDHGWAGCKLVMPVTGTAKITVGSCTFASGNITVTNSDGETVATFTQGMGSCWGGNADRVTIGYYKTNSPTTLTINVPSYVPYIKVEYIDPADIVSDADVKFDAGDTGLLGVMPKEYKQEIGTDITLPVNRTMYVEGKTMTGWTDGKTNTVFAPGSSYTVTENVTFTPVFAENEASLDDAREAEVTIKWDFQQKNGAPVVAWQGGSETKYWIAQAEVNGKTIDVAATIDVSGGKVANGNWQDWAQINNGTKMQIPSAINAKVSVEAYNDLSTLTIDGSSDYTPSKTIQYVVDSKNNPIEIVFSNDGSYYRYVQIVLPPLEKKPDPVTDKASTVTFALTTANPDQQAVLVPAEYFSTSYIELGSNLAWAGTKTVEGHTQGAFQPGSQDAAAGDNNMIKLAYKTKTGITFTPTKISFRCYRHGTNGGLLDVKILNGDGTKTDVASGIIPMRNNLDTSQTPAAVSYYEATITDGVATEGEGALAIYLYSLGSTKQVSVGDVVIEGLLNGEIADIPTYTVNVNIVPEGAGTVKVSPAGEEFDEGTKMTLTQTKNFGYRFVNWTNADGEVLGTDDQYKFDINANTVINANYEAVATYALDLNVAGGANDYMVTVAPAATVVDGKNMYEEDTKVTLTAEDRPILTFTGWSNGETSYETSLIMNQDQSITANYEASDFIAGWDFYTSGNNSRKADFAAEDNDADVLILRDADGNVSGWLDKSQMAAGGYEGKPAAVNWKDISLKYYYQTKVNAESFTDIKVQAEMLYNYIAYKTQILEWSLDNENWTEAARITFSGAKSWTPIQADLPSDCNNAKELYIRFIPDYTSATAGSGSTNDGTAITAIYVTGTAKYVDDGVPPVLVSTVPAEGSTDASANGKIVLTFDEKVVLTDENAVALLDGETQLPLVATGTTVTAEYKGLEYCSTHSVTIPAGVIADRGGQVYADAITINFTVKNMPAVQKKLYDFVVPTDGSFEDAIAKAIKRADTGERFRIFVLKGSYKLEGDAGATVVGSDNNTYRKPTTTVNTPNISIIGEDMDNTELYNYHENFHVIEGLNKAQAINFSSKTTGAYVQDITFRNGCSWDTTNNGDGRCPALQDEGNKNVFKNFKIMGWQDSYLSNNQGGRYYFENCDLHGAVDYLCGKGNAIYNQCNLIIERNGVPLCAPSQRGDHGGYTFLDCEVHSANPTYYKEFTLGRPWGSGTPEAIYINLKVGDDVSLSSDGWAEMSGGYPYRFAEYNTMTEKGTPVDLSKRKKTFGDGHSNVPVLTAAEAAQYTVANIHGYDGWDPQSLTEQASEPKNVVIDGTSLTWENNDYVLCWAVLKDGAVVGFTKTPEWTADDASAVWSVRAANEMGGLGEAAEAQTPTAINELTPNSQTLLNSGLYNINGIRVSKNYKGIVIENGKKMVVK